jgi:hypothetical protein
MDTVPDDGLSSPAGIVDRWIELPGGRDDGAGFPPSLCFGEARRRAARGGASRPRAAESGPHDCHQW